MIFTLIAHVLPASIQYECRCYFVKSTTNYQLVATSERFFTNELNCCRCTDTVVALVAAKPTTEQTLLFRQLVDNLAASHSDDNN